MMPLRSSLFELCSKTELNPNIKYHYSLKYDGSRSFVVIQGGKIVKLLNRRGYDRLDGRFPHFKDFKFNFDAIIDAEIVCYDETGKSSLFNLLQKENWSKARLVAFDILKLGDKNLMREKFCVRWKQLVGVLKSANPFQIQIAKEFSSLEKGWKYVIDGNYEGIVAKAINSYYMGGRSKRWIKMINPQYDRIADTMGGE